MCYRIISLSAFIVSLVACASTPVPPQRLCPDEAACRADCEAGDAAACARAEVMAPRPDESPEARTVRLCEAGGATACHEAGTIFAEGRGVAADPARALASYEKACGLGHGDGCAAAGVMVRDGRGRAADATAAAALFEKGCGAGSAESCAELAAQLESGLGVPQDRARAFSLNRDACAKRQPRACHALGSAHEHGHGTAVDLDAASTAYRTACGLGWAAACLRAGQLAEQGKGAPANTAEIFEMYVAGWNGGDRDATLAAARLRLKGGVAFAKDPAEWDRKLFDDACKLDYHEACVERGYALRLGDSADVFHAQKLGENACAHDVATGCNLAGLIAYGVAGDLKQAESFYARGCAMGNLEACANQGALLVQCTRGGPCDMKRGKELLQTACAQKVDFACRELASILRRGNAADKAAAAALVERSCELGNAEACYEAALGARARPDARRLFERACSLGDQVACFQFAAMLESGDGGPVDVPAAGRVMQAQCADVPKGQRGDACNGWCQRHPEAGYCR